MALFNARNLDADIFQDFLDEFREHYQQSEDLIMQLEERPDDIEGLKALFRAVHTIKGNLGLLDIRPLIDLLQELENILHLLREGEIQFKAYLGDLALLLLDRTSSFLDQCLVMNDVEYDDRLFDQIQSLIHQTIDASGNKRDQLLLKALSILDPNTVLDVTKPEESEFLVSFDIRMDADLKYLYHMATESQLRTQFWQGRLNRVLSLLLTLNEYSGNPVEPSQLVVAACAHDIAMAFLPSSLLEKNEPLTDEERNRMRSHIRLALQLLAPYPQWQPAQTILEQHHEHNDGGGYPVGLKGKQINDGAQMLAVVHTFEAITHGFSKEEGRKRPLMRAIMELNRYAGAQFDNLWVTRFMEVSKALSESNTMAG